MDTDNAKPIIAPRGNHERVSKATHRKAHVSAQRTAPWVYFPKTPVGVIRKWQVCETRRWGLVLQAFCLLEGRGRVEGKLGVTKMIRFDQLKLPDSPYGMSRKRHPCSYTFLGGPHGLLEFDRGSELEKTGGDLEGLPVGMQSVSHAEG